MYPVQLIYSCVMVGENVADLQDRVEGERPEVGEGGRARRRSEGSGGGCCNVGLHRISGDGGGRGCGAATSLSSMGRANARAHRGPWEKGM